MKEYIIEKSKLKHNIEIIKKRANGVAVMGIVKCNGYGLGLLEYSRFLLENGIDLLGVSTVEEGVLLREGGILSDIVLLTSYSTQSDALKIAENGLIATVGSVLSAQTLENAGKEKGVVPKAHIEINTGMGRCGFSCEDIGKILSLKDKKIDFCGCFTHFSFSFAKDKRYVNIQLEKFKKVIDELNKNGFKTGVIHAANSNAFLRYEDTFFDMVRVGSALLGRVEGAKSFGLEKVGYLKTNIIETNFLKKGENIGYANTYRVKKDTETAVIPIGYSDGFMVEKKKDTFRFFDILRYVFNDLKPKKYYVKINNKNARILGRVGMFNIIADITNIDAKAGDDVIADANPVFLDSSIERKYL